MPSSTRACCRCCSRGNGRCCCAFIKGGAINSRSRKSAGIRIPIETRPAGTNRATVDPLLASHALLARCIKLISRLPSLLDLCTRRQPAQIEAKLRHSRIPSEIHLRLVLIARLMVPLRGELLHLLFAPVRVVTRKERTLPNRKRRNSIARQREMIGAVVVPRARKLVRLNRQIKVLR